ncbi:MAG: hypothetical protein ACRCZ5_13215, partial [Burkholderiales bacterium]
IVFLHHVLPGPASQSYGLAVAQLAGVPNDVDLPKPRNRLELAHNAAYHDYRSAVLEFLYQRHARPAAAA